MEHRLDKRRILDIYLNVVEWGDDAWGVARAAARHFAKTSDALTLPEALDLASRLPAPRAPMTGANRERERRSQQRILFDMYLSGLVPARYWSDAQRFIEAPDTLPRSANRLPARPPYRAVADHILRDSMVGSECGTSVLEREEAARERLLGTPSG